MTRVICAGLITLDAVFELDALPHPGQKGLASACRLGPGGGALHAAATVAALGGRPVLVGRIGADTAGETVRAALPALGIDGSRVTALAGHATPTSAILLTADGERTIVNHRDPALFEGGIGTPLPETFEAALADTRWPQVAAELMAAARSLGRPGVIDAEAPVAPAQAAVSLASHVVFSEQGLADYTGDAGARGLSAAARRLGVWVAVTRGPAPVLVDDGSGPREIPTPLADAIDTLGAGDVWHGAFALALGRGLSEDEAVRLASAAAALKVGRRGLLGALPTADEVAAACRSGHTGQGHPARR